jgi:hypothetical protein
MRLTRYYVALIGLLLSATLARAAGETDVRIEAGHVHVRFNGVPLSTALERLANASGTKIEFLGGVPPSARVVTEFERATPIEAMLTLLDGADVVYVAQVDDSGTRFAKLLIGGPSALAGGSGAGAAAATPFRGAGMRRPMVPPPEYEPDPPPEPEEEPVEPEPPTPPQPEASQPAVEREGPFVRVPYGPQQMPPGAPPEAVEPPPTDQ